MSSFFGLRAEDKPAIHDQIFSLCFHGKGGFNFTEVYNMPIYLRHFYIKKAQQFYNIVESIVKNWEKARTEMLIACHDKYPSTDVVFALAYRIMDPTASELIDYDWFKFIHHKPAVNGVGNVKDQNNYFYPTRSGDAVYIGETRVSRVWHYHDKELHARIV